MVPETGHQLDIIFAFPVFGMLPINIDPIKVIPVDKTSSAHGEARAAAFVRTCIRKSGLVPLCSADGQNEFEMAVTGLELCESPETTLGPINGNVAVSFVVIEL